MRPSTLSPQPSSSVPVHTLVCESHLSFAIPCLQSFLRHSADPVRLLIHSDGSLSPQSVERLLTALPGAAVIHRAEADSLLEQRLTRLPMLAQLRRSLPHALKLFDVHLLHNADPITRYLDSDIFFFRSFRALFSPEPDCPAVFSCDSQNSFAARCSDFWPLGPLVLGRRVNSGLFWIRNQLLDFDRFEWLCRRWGPCRIAVYGGWFEQTLWADLAWRLRARLFHPADLRTATSADHGQRDEVAIHYVTPARKHLLQVMQNPALVKGHAAADASGPAVVRTIPITAYTLADSLLASLRVRLCSQPAINNLSQPLARAGAAES